MNIKVIVTLIMVMMGGGFMMGCIEAPALPEEIEIMEVVEIPEVVEVVEVVEVLEVIEVISNPTSLIFNEETFKEALYMDSTEEIEEMEAFVSSIFEV